MEQPAASRPAFLADSCAHDPELRREVVSLLAQQDVSSVLDRSGGPAAAAILAPEPLTPGTMIGPHRIVGVLGVGGMGEVYRAHDTKVEREVAVKILPDAFAHDPDRLARFTREAQVLARFCSKR